MKSEKPGSTGFGDERDAPLRKNIEFLESKLNKLRLENGSGSPAEQRRRDKRTNEFEKQLNELRTKAGSGGSGSGSSRSGAGSGSGRSAAGSGSAGIRSQQPNLNKLYAQEREEVIRHSDIILCTLNSAALVWLDKLLSSKNIRILCVIVDEACQAKEVENLIPLKWRTNKLILVGDPCQLPPTVLSLPAKDKSFDRSMFERILQTLDESEKVVKFLDTQYRMVPEIAEFPSRQFYDDRLKTDPKIRRPPEFIQKPYFVFDVHYGEEKRGKSGSYQNTAEVDFVVELGSTLLRLTKQAPNSLGIITPYKDQVRILQEKFRSTKFAAGATAAAAGADLSGVEIGTVDSFQGRQKPMIVVSCVRGSTKAHGIGFLADGRRLNVALTRAQYGMYIVGNLNVLRRHSGWSELISDAKKRRLVASVASSAQIGTALALLNQNR